MKKAKRAVNYLLYIAQDKTAYNYKSKCTFKFKVNFVTLTLPSRQQHSDTMITNTLLNQFLVEAKSKWHLNNYVWKAERQMNGNIHFHILCDCFIPWMEARNCWNRICNKLGYVDEYEKINHKRNPNSTDIHSVKNVKNVAAYVTKYMTKSHTSVKYTVNKNTHAQLYPALYTPNSLSNNTKLYLKSCSELGRLWSCSYSLTHLTGAVIEVDEAIALELKRLKALKNTHVINKQYFTGIYYKQQLLNKTSFPLLTKLLDSYIHEKFNDPPSTLIIN